MEMIVAAIGGRDGMPVVFGQSVHCVAAEPHATFLRVAVEDRGRQVAFETAVLGRLKYGFRIFQLRSLLGTRIELAYLLVRISFGVEDGVPWGTARQVRLRASSSD